MNPQLDPGHIMQTATVFWTSKVLLAAVEFDLFTTLGEESMTADELGGKLELSARGRFDFFDALVALGFLGREGDGPDGRYHNTPETAAFLNRNSTTYIGGMPEMLNARLYGFWNHLGEALRTGELQNEVKTHGKHIFEELYAHDNKLHQFLTAMTGFQAGNFTMLAEKFDLGPYKTVTDVGGALSLLSCIIGEHHPHLNFKTFDLPPVASHAQEHVDAA